MAADYGISVINWTSPTETMLRASNTAENNYFGNSVAISGNYAIVGATHEDESSTNILFDSGAAYIFELDDSGNWIQRQILRASNLGASDQFGISVAISGNTAIVGAWQEDGTSISATTDGCGAAYIFERDGSGNWTEKTILRASNLGASDQFGVSVAISGNCAIVGAFEEDGTSVSATTDGCGAAYIFERDGSGNWTEKTILRASNLGASDYFGWSVAISGNYAIVGAFQEDGTSVGATTDSCGAAYIFERNGSGNWIQNPTILRASNLGASDQFGRSVAISGTYAIVGAFAEDGASNTTGDSGAAYIFERNSGTGVWNETRVLRASNLGAGDLFGRSVAISGNYAIVGADAEDGTNNTITDCGAAYIFERNDSGVWTEIKLLRATNVVNGSQDNFGKIVAIDGNYVIVGIPGDDGTSNNISSSGAANIFKGSVVGLNPTALSFVNNTLTIANSIDSTDTDPVSFSLTAGTTLTSLNVSAFSGSGTVTYTLAVSGGANVVTGTFNATNANLLTGGPLTASVNTTYKLTLTSNASITYSIFGLLVTGAFTYTKIITSGFTLSQLTTAGYNIANLKANGITDVQLLGAGYTIAVYASQGLLPDWNFDASASHIIKSYVTDFIDISGSVVLRNNANLYVHGNAQLGGNLSLNRPAINADLSFNNRIFVGGDVSMNGKVNIGGNVSLIGSVVNCSNVANDSVPQSAFNGSVSSGPDYTAAKVAYRQNFQANDDVSMNGTTVQANNVRANGNIVFSDGTIMNSYDNNILSTNPTVFKPSTFTSLAINGNLTAGSYSTSSDYRIKTEVVQLDETFTVDNLRPVKYVQTLINKTQYGLIAHELQEYYPDLVVGEKDGDGWQRVNYTGLIAILINEIKRMKQDLAELEGEV